MFQPYFWWSSELECGQPAPDLLLQALPYSHKRFARSAEWIPAMREVQRIVRETEFSNSSFPMSLAYVNWETDAIVGIELLRNIGIALGKNSSQYQLTLLMFLSHSLHLHHHPGDPRQLAGLAAGHDVRPPHLH